MLKVSVIVPSYNHEDFIGESITSILNQTFQDFEILILDDSSIDKSLEIANKFTDKRISVFVNDENIGSSATMNKLIQLAKGEYIALLNSDDVWEPNKLEKQVEFMENNRQYGAVFSNAKIIDEEGNEFTNKEHFYTSIFELSNRSRFEWLNYFFNIGNCLCHPSILIRRSVYEDIGLYNQLMSSLPDFEMWVRICLKYEIYVMSEKLVKFRILNNEKNASSYNPSNTIRCQFEYKQILNHFLLLSNEDYEFVFKEKVEKHFILLLSNNAIKSDRKFMQSWGIEILYKFLQNSSKYMKANEFTKLTALNDIFSVIKVDNYYIQLYIEKENIFSEEDSIKFFIQETNEVQKFQFDLTNHKNITSLRLDPMNDCCVVEIEKVYLVLENAGEVDILAYLSSNNIISYDNNYLFEDFDPQIYFLGLDIELLNSAKKLCIELKYNHISKDALHECVKQITIDKNENIVILRNKNLDLENKNLELQEILSTLEKELIQIYNSKGWKIIKLLGSIIKKLKFKKDI